MYVPTVALAALLLLVAGAMFGYSAYGERKYLAELKREIALLEPRAKRAGALDRALDQARGRAALLDEFRRRSKADLDALQELTRLLEPPAWTTAVHLTRDAVTLAGETEQAAPLLKLLDDSPYFRDSSFAVPISRGPKTEIFRIRTGREAR